MSAYVPPFTLTDRIASLLVEVAELSAAVSLKAANPSPVLRRQNRIRTIHSSLAIEQNTLTLEQVTAVLSGKRVLAPPQDIREVQNAYEAYEQMSLLDPYDLGDLLKAHAFMMAGLVRDAGCFRSGNAGVFNGTALIHAGTPAAYVPETMTQLFGWLKSSDYPLLLKSCIFHYEFEFIHPFSDGNGRTGRLWHSLLLQSWKPIFAWLPIETLIHDRQAGYYAALNESNTQGSSTAFVTFMLTLIRDALKEAESTETASDVGMNVGVNVGIDHGDRLTDSERACLLLLQQDVTLSAQKIAESLHLTTRQVERLIASLRQKHRIERIGSSRWGRWHIIAPVKG